MIGRMGSLVLAVLAVAGIVLTVVVGLLIIGVAKRGRCDAGSRVVAIVVGAVVFALVALNLYQYTAAPATMVDSGSTLQRRARATTAGVVTTQPATQESRLEPA